MQQAEKYDTYLKKRYKLGLTGFAISIVSTNSEENRKNYLPKSKSYINLEGLIEKTKDIGLYMRLTCVLLKNVIDTPENVLQLIKFAKKNEVEQLTLRPVNAPDTFQDETTELNARALALTQEKKDAILASLEENGVLVRNTWYGAKTFDVGGQNVSFTNSMTSNIVGKRQIIFQANGKISYDWQYPGGSTLM